VALGASTPCSTAWSAKATRARPGARRRRSAGPTQAPVPRHRTGPQRAPRDGPHRARLAATDQIQRGHSKWCTRGTLSRADSRTATRNREQDRGGARVGRAFGRDMGDSICPAFARHDSRGLRGSRPGDAAPRLARRSAGRISADRRGRRIRLVSSRTAARRAPGPSWRSSHRAGPW